MESPVKDVATHFGFNVQSIKSLTEGLIHKTYQVGGTGSQSIILQQVNTSVFTNPHHIIANYQLLYQHLGKSNGIKIPTLIKTVDGEYLYQEGSNYWRAFEYIIDSYTENLPGTPEKVFSAAQCYGAFMNSLSGLNAARLQPAITRFHDLNNRSNQLHHAIRSATDARLTASKPWLERIEARKSILNFYNHVVQHSEFKLRAMHHDCKLSNILFHTRTKRAICPIDLDTVMPGYFFSDVGDMVRSMVPDTGEDSRSAQIAIRTDFYKAIVSGYRSGVGDVFTQTEFDHIHHAGPIMIYMQAIRFLADYLSNDVYYKIDYPEQNFDRAVNQLTLLEKVESFLEAEYSYTIR
jgi:Ser/Thr protein kinase RdoA (MazF antagonist)